MTKPSLQYVKGVGPKIADHLSRLGLNSPKDVLYFVPRDYEDRRSITPIASCKIDETVQIFAKILHHTTDETRRGFVITRAVLADASGQISGIWFNQPHLRTQFRVGAMIYIKGKITRDSRTRELVIQAAIHDVYKEGGSQQTDNRRIYPLYHLTPGLTQNRMRQIVGEIINHHLVQIKDYLSADQRKKLKLRPLGWAIKMIHFPNSDADRVAARNRLVFDEFFLYQLSLALQKRHQNRHRKGVPLTPSGQLTQAYLAQLPYTLTRAQTAAIADIQADVCRNQPMNRLVQGDVGSGKTDVAVMAMLMAIESGKQAALMAPTEILAEQHYLKLSRLLTPLGIDVAVLLGKTKASERKAIAKRLEQPTPMVVVGTHALIQDGVILANLGLAVIDEQHRFGVMQRQTLLQKGTVPHSLFMTATPIPRTLLITAFGDLDKSIIDEMPPGRKPIKTAWVRGRETDKLMQFCVQEVQAGRQVYVVYPLIDKSEKMDLRSAIRGWEQLRRTYFSDQTVGLLHGRLPGHAKAHMMQAFRDGYVQVLVSTTVIEVGVDVPNASTMVIIDAQRFGLSQLHQLRGRVGRGADKSYCFLVGTPKTPESQKRLDAMVATTDGFKIAQADLKIRGPGDMLGTRQAGLPDFGIGDVVVDDAILVFARNQALRLVDQDPLLAKAEHQQIRQALIDQHNPLLFKALN